MLQAVPDAVARGVVDGPDDVLERMRDQATRIGTATLTRYAEVVHAGLGEMRGATAPRLLLEVVCARLLLPSASDTESALLQRVERIETRLDMSIPAGEAAASPPCRAAEAIRPQEQAPEPPEPRPHPGPSAEPAPEPPPAPKAAPEPGRLRPRRCCTAAAAASRGPAPISHGNCPMRPAMRERCGPPCATRFVERSRTTECDAGGRDRARRRRRHAGAQPRIGAAGENGLCEQRNSDVIREALKDALGVDWKIRCEAVAAHLRCPDPRAPAAPQRRPRMRTTCWPRPATDSLRPHGES